MTTTATTATDTTTTPAIAWGYERVSTTSQTTDRQTDALIAAGIDPSHIVSDKISGAKQSRPGLDQLIGKDGKARAGDKIIVTSLDRLGRSALHVLQTIADLSKRGITVVSLKDSENMGGASGELMRGLAILVSEWERSMNRERVAEARAARAARAKAGEQIDGRPRSALTPAKISKARALKAKGRTAAEIATLTGMSRASAYRALAD